MRLPVSAHTRTWRIHEIAPDFRVEDVWSLDTPGGPDGLRLLVEQFAAGGSGHGGRRGRGARTLVLRALFAVRAGLGRLLHWDTPEAGLGARVRSLRQRLPEDLRSGERGPDIGGAISFDSLYLTRDEWAAENANRTVHAVLHLGWVPDGRGGHRGELTVLAKPNGPLGRCYMAVIKPFRYALVYPALLRTVEREWRAREQLRGEGRG
ncbi:DUF2867 domain-containing protein [Streptomyces sp. NPDC090029]|uniref:DUF2867 domain-containing protein n=1 Tax=Streptomyces sp. NPDC090029 TaxID=3365924 RepID=UPI003802AA7B